MGDKGVGKTSLISTFVSRHFVSEGLPGCMTRITLPPDTTTYMPYFVSEDDSNNLGFVTSIVDTQDADAASFLVNKKDDQTNRNISDSDMPVLFEPPTPTPKDHDISPNSSLSSPTTTHNNATSSSSSSDEITHTPPATPSAAAAAARAKAMSDVDVIVLVYDLDKQDTFDRLESHWLPFIQASFAQEQEVPVIIAGNKLDLWLDNQTVTSTQQPQPQHTTTATHPHTPTDRQRIVSLLQRFKFVRQCIKCSAKTLFHISEIFQKAQHCVLFPIKPLYDLSSDCLSHLAQRAFCRIFRMMDLDKDGSLSSDELSNFQKRCFRVWGPLLDDTLSGWNKVLSKKILSTNRATSNHQTIYFYPYHNNNSQPVQQPSSDDEETSSAVALLREGKFTLAGFFSIFEVFMSKDRMEIPWQILRIYGYDDSLQLHIPSSVTASTKKSSVLLSPCAISFLISLFEQFDIDKDGVLTQEDMTAMFAISSDALPPWHPSRSQQAYKDSFSIPKLFGYYDTELDHRPSTATNKTNNNNNNNNGFALSLPDVDSSFTADGITLASANSSNGNNNNHNNTNNNIILLTPTTSAAILQESNTAKVVVEEQQLSANGTEEILSSGEQQTTRRHPPFSLLDWLSYWFMSACISPSITRAELFKLGHVESTGNTVSGSSIGAHWAMGKKRTKFVTSSSNQQLKGILNKHSNVIRIRVFGKAKCGKIALLHALCQTNVHTDNNILNFASPKNPSEDEESYPISACAHMIFTSSTSTTCAGIGAAATARFPATATTDGDNDVVVHFVFTDIPEATALLLANEQEERNFVKKDCDLVMLVFNCSDRSSFMYLLDLEERLLFLSSSSENHHQAIPRLFIGIRSESTSSNSNTDDTTSSSSESSFVERQEEADVLAMARVHCLKLDIEPPLVLSTTTSVQKEVTNAISPSHAVLLSPNKSFIFKRLIQYTRCCSGILQVLKESKLKSIPFEYQQQDLKEKKKRRFIWIGAATGLFVSAVIVWTSFWPSQKIQQNNKWWWKRLLFLPQKTLRY